MVAIVGAAALLWISWPINYDGILNTDPFAVAFLAGCGSVLAAVGGVAEGLLERSDRRLAGRVALMAFAVVAIYPPLLSSARWFASEDDTPGSSSAFGLALVMWLLAVGGQWAIARVLRGNAQGGMSS